MQALNKNQWIAVVVGIAVIAFVLYGGVIMNAFNQASGEPQANQNEQVPEITGIQIRDTVVGQGAEAVAGDTLTVHYVGILTDGRVFDSSLDRNAPFSFTLGTGQVIRGWDEGLVGMKVGGRRQLLIAPEYAYGPNAVGPIPPNSALVFEVELLEVKK